MPGKLEMPISLASTDKLAALKALPAAESQSFHVDSPEPGCSGVTAFEEDQYIDVLFGAFAATVVLQELQVDRKQATELARSRLAALTPPFACSDEEWEAILEPRAWEFLVHQELKARGAKDFEVVRVRVEKNKTIVLDSRTPHAGTPPPHAPRRTLPAARPPPHADSRTPLAGTPWTGKPGCKRLFKGHFYGFREDLLKRNRVNLTEKDELTTVDLCDNDHFPIFSWAQRGAAGPLFAQ